jgi:hypothetical protein
MEPATGNPLGDPPPVIGESDRTPDRSSPQATLRSVLDGREREDLPFLARCESLSAEKDVLDKMDAARAHRRFCAKAVGPYWSRIEGALEAGAATFAVEEESATGIFEVGGALGRVEIRFVRIDGDWYLRSGE